MTRSDDPVGAPSAERCSCRDDPVGMTGGTERRAPSARPQLFSKYFASRLAILVFPCYSLYMEYGTYVLQVITVDSDSTSDAYLRSVVERYSDAVHYCGSKPEPDGATFHTWVASSDDSDPMTVYTALTRIAATVRQDVDTVYTARVYQPSEHWMATLPASDADILADASARFATEHPTGALCTACGERPATHDLSGQPYCSACAQSALDYGRLHTPEAFNN